MRPTTILPLLMLFAASPAIAQRQNIYDAQGRFQGYTERDGDRTTRYDAAGRRTGYSERQAGGTVRHYDAQGRIAGSSETQPLIDGYR